MNAAVATALDAKNTQVTDIAEEESKFDQVIIHYETHNLSKDRVNWDNMCVEDQRELLARGAVRFFKNEEEVPFYRALL